MIHYLLLLSRQGKIRLSKWYSVALKEREKHKIQQQVSQLVLSRPKKNCNFIEYRDGKIVYRRYASLYFVCFTDATDNELLTLEIIHHFVEALDRYFGSVCELDVIFNFHKAYYLLDETLIAGELCEPSKHEIVRHVTAQDSLVEQINAGAAPLVPPSTSMSSSSSSLDDAGTAANRTRAEHLRRNLQAAGLPY